MNIENSKLQFLSSHIKKYYLWWMIAAYYAFSIILYFTVNMDIFPPCIFKLITGYQCPGCGLTSASLQLLQLNITGAWQSNPLVFVVLPILGYYILKSFYEEIKIV